MPSAAAKPGFGRVALIGKLRSAEIAESLRELRGMLEQRGCEVLIERETASDLGLRGVDYAAIGAEAKLAIVVGGDGTMLAAARNLVRHHVPLVGVNQGRVGFMTARGIAIKKTRFATSFGRGLDYYTGFEFELHNKGDGVEPLVAGGRYDGLMTQLGSRAPIPAVGFSVWVEALTATGRKPAAAGKSGGAS